MHCKDVLLKTHRLVNPLMMAILLLLIFTGPAGGETIKLNIEGLKGEEFKNVQATLELPIGIIKEDLINWRWLGHYQKQIPEQVSKALEPFGYFHSRSEVELKEKSEGDYLLAVRVNKGRPVVLTKVDIAIEGTAKKNRQVARAVRDFPLKTGDILRQDYYTQGKHAIRNAAVNQGFLKAGFSRHEIRIFPEKNQAEIELHLASGQQYSFGEVTFNGAEKYPRDFLLRYVDFKPGNIYLSPKWDRTRANFQNANRFSDVVLIAKIEEADENSRVPIEINLTALPSKRWRNGIGYGDSTGPRLLSNYQDVNIFGAGHEFNTDITLGEKYQLAELRYTIPEYTHVKNAHVLSTGIEREENDIYQSTSGFVEWEKMFFLGSGKVGSFYTRYAQESFEISDQENTSRLLLPGIRYIQRSYNDPVNPRKGYQFRLELRGAEEHLLSDVSLLQGLAAGNTFWPLFEKFSLFLRLEAGYTIKNDAIAEIPTSLRFFVGGDNSVRGYAYNSEGPRDENGEVVGGEALLVGSLEVEREMGERWGLAAFYDTGSAFNPGNDTRFIQGAGAGIRIYTPVGPLKMDIARQIGEDDPSYRFHLSIGFDL